METSGPPSSHSSFYFEQPTNAEGALAEAKYTRLGCFRSTSILGIAEENLGFLGLLALRLKRACYIPSAEI
jgi:hypothetical protein